MLLHGLTFIKVLTAVVILQIFYLRDNISDQLKLIW